MYVQLAGPEIPNISWREIYEKPKNGKLLYIIYRRLFLYSFLGIIIKKGRNILILTLIFDLKHLRINYDNIHYFTIVSGTTLPES